MIRRHFFHITNLPYIPLLLTNRIDGCFMTVCLERSKKNDGAHNFRAKIPAVSLSYNPTGQL